MDTLPSEMLAHILSYLPAKDVHLLRRTSRKFGATIQQYKRDMKKVSVRLLLRGNSYDLQEPFLSKFKEGPGPVPRRYDGRISVIEVFYMQRHLTFEVTDIGFLLRIYEIFTEKLIPLQFANYAFSNAAYHSSRKLFRRILSDSSISIQMLSIWRNEFYEKVFPLINSCRCEVKEFSMRRCFGIYHIHRHLAALGEMSLKACKKRVAFHAATDDLASFQILSTGSFSKLFHFSFEFLSLGPFLYSFVYLAMVFLCFLFYALFQYWLKSDEVARIPFQAVYCGSLSEVFIRNETYLFPENTSLIGWTLEEFYAAQRFHDIPASFGCLNNSTGRTLWFQFHYDRTQPYYTVFQEHVLQG